VRILILYHGIEQSETELEEACETSWLGNTCEELASESQKLGFAVEVICLGILVVGEFTLYKEGNFINIPTKQEMLKTAEIEALKLPFLFYGVKRELDDKGIKLVTILRRIT
jgi:hypothetical protein